VQVRRERLEAPEAAVAQATQAAKDAAAAAKAAVEAAAALNEEEQLGGDEDAEGSVTPKDHRHCGSPSPPRSRGRSPVGRSTVRSGPDGRCSRAPTTTSGVSS